MMGQQEELVKDLVCGMIKPKNQMGFSLVYRGKTYYFCSLADKEMFAKYPDRWTGGEEK